MCVRPRFAAAMSKLLAEAQDNSGTPRRADGDTPSAAADACLLWPLAPFSSSDFNLPLGLT